MYLCVVGFSALLSFIQIFKLVLFLTLWCKMRIINESCFSKDTVISFISQGLKYCPKRQKNEIIQNYDHSSTPPHLYTLYGLDIHRQASSLIWSRGLFSLLTRHCIWWDGEIAALFFPAWIPGSLSTGDSLHAQLLDHGKAINAADHFVAMYKQRTQISSMSNHIHSLIPRWLFGGRIQTQHNGF